MQNIIQQLKKAGLTGRGGANFPTALKWQMVKRAKAEKRYIICNAAESEPHTYKDWFLLKYHAKEVVAGINIALKTLDKSQAFIFLKKDYYPKLKKSLEKEIGNKPIEIFKKTGGYLSGEETTLISEIEGKRPEPSIRPPFPTQVGLWGCPTLINNVETFYFVAQIAKDQYKQTRFYSVSTPLKNLGVYDLPIDYTIEQVLRETKNWPSYDFFVQVGGGASGEILLPNELKQSVKTAGSIIIYNKKITNPYKLLQQWADFYLVANCDKCAPCREGVYRLAEMVKSKKLEAKTLDDLYFVLEETSFCALGRGVVLPFKGIINKIINAKK